jgi:hypothetical protein
MDEKCRIVLSDLKTILEIDTRLLHYICDHIDCDIASDGVWVRFLDLRLYEELLADRERSSMDDMATDDAIAKRLE